MTGIQIKHYAMLFKNEDSHVHKRNKKKLSKKYVFKRIHFDFVKYYDDNKLLNTFYKYLLSVKKLHVPYCGILLDTNIIMHDITRIPKPPVKYDILCLESELESYKKNEERGVENNIYWTPTNITNSGNFIINGASIDKLLTIIKSSKNINDFYTNINTLNIYTITQTFFSEKEKHHIHDPLIINKQLTQKEILEYDAKLEAEFYDKFMALQLSIDKLNKINIKDELLPKLSLICPFTNKDYFFNALLSFLKLDYPRHLLELIIVDDTNSEKELNLPEDKRIKLINISNKNDANGKDTLPLGYKLNAGVKYASNELILHFFDENMYNLDLRTLVGHFILSEKECIMSYDTGLYNKTLNARITLPDLANCLYTKRFWKKCSFEEFCHPFLVHSDLVYKWISYRYKEISFIPFVYMSFKIVNNNDSALLNKKEDCTLDLLTIVDKKIKESFELFFK